MNDKRLSSLLGILDSSNILVYYIYLPDVVYYKICNPNNRVLLVANAKNRSAVGLNFFSTFGQTIHWKISIKTILNCWMSSYIFLPSEDNSPKVCFIGVIFVSFQNAWNFAISSAFSLDNFKMSVTCFEKNYLRQCNFLNRVRIFFSKVQTNFGKTAINYFNFPINPKLVKTKLQQHLPVRA